MQLLKIQFNILIILVFLNLYVRNSSIGVGFLTTNMEGGQFTIQEYNHLFQLFNYVSSDKLDKDHGILNSIDDASVSPNGLKNLDFIMISIQESDSSVIDLNQFNSLLDNSEWVCEPIAKKSGLIGLSIPSTIISICHRRFFMHSYTVSAKVSFFSNKFIAGNCFPIGDSDFCFLGGHLPVKINKGAKLLAEAMSDINSKIKPNRNYFAYVAGDINTRAGFEVDTQESLVNKIIDTDWDLTRNNSPDTIKNISNKFKADSKTVEEFKKFYFLAKTTKGTKDNSYVRFVGRNQMSNLPFTYKYKGGDTEQYNHKKIFDKKAADDNKTEVFNIGWLDRMLCINSDGKEHSCRLMDKEIQDLNNGFIEDEYDNDESVRVNESDDDINRKVKYFLVPFLKKGDHMPVLGYLRLNADLTEINKNSRKVKIKKRYLK